MKFVAESALTEIAQIPNLRSEQYQQIKQILQRFDQSSKCVLIWQAEDMAEAYRQSWPSASFLLEELLIEANQGLLEEAVLTAEHRHDATVGIDWDVLAIHGEDEKEQVLLNAIAAMPIDRLNELKTKFSASIKEKMKDSFYRQRTEMISEIPLLRAVLKALRQRRQALS